MIEFQDFSVLAWNVRDMASRRSQHHVREVLAQQKPDLVFVFETHVGFSGTARFWDKQGYVAIMIEEAKGHTVGIWALTCVGGPYCFQVIESMTQCISLEVIRGSKKWLCTGVYASPTYNTRCHFWDYLMDFCHRVSLPWALLGDFNDILLPSEQRGCLL